jgi:hypothetical protein
MNLGLFIGCLAILVAAYWWVLNRLKPRVMRLGLIGAGNRQEPKGRRGPVG